MMKIQEFLDLSKVRSKKIPMLLSIFTTALAIIAVILMFNIKVRAEQEVQTITEVKTTSEYNNAKLQEENQRLQQQNEKLLQEKSDLIATNNSLQKRIYTAEIEFENTPVINPLMGVNYYKDLKETYYNLDMSGVMELAEIRGFVGKYWVREDGVKMFDDYIILAADFDTYPIGSIVETSLGYGIVLDTGYLEPNQVDIAVSW